MTLLTRLLPPSLVSPLVGFTATLLGTLHALNARLVPLLTTVVSEPSIASILGLLAILYISLQILDIFYRIVMSWVRMVWTILKWSFIVFTAFWIYSRGIEGAMDDAKALAEFWIAQYHQFERDAKVYSKAEEAQIKMQAHAAAGPGRRMWG